MVACEGRIAIVWFFLISDFCYYAYLPYDTLPPPSPHLYRTLYPYTYTLRTPFMYLSLVHASTKFYG